MKEDFKTFLADWEISEERFKGMADELQFKYIELFEKSKSQGELFIHSIFDFMLFRHVLVLLDDFML
jgi:hypothetical protein